MTFPIGIGGVGIPGGVPINTDPMYLKPSPGALDVTREVGHGQLTNFWAYLDDEPTPELQWPHSIYVYDRMRRQDAQVKSVLRAVTMPVQQATWRIYPGDATQKVTKFIATQLGLPIVGENPQPQQLPRTRDRFSWQQHVGWALLCTAFGHMFFEQVYRLDEETGLYSLRKLAPRWPKTIERVVTDVDGGLASITQRPLPNTSEAKRGALPIVIPVDRLVAYVNEREGGNWLGQSLLRAAYKHWLLKDQALRTWSQVIDRNGMGVPVYQAGEEETDLNNGLAIATRHRSGASSGAAIPYGAKFDLKGVTGALPNIENNVRYHDEAIAASVLAHFLNLGQATGTGSYALGSTFIDFFVMSLQGLAQLVADTATAHIVEDLVDVNFGPDVPAPSVVFDPIGQNMSSVVTAVQMLIASGAIFPDPALDAFVRNLVGLPPKAPLPNPQTPAGAQPGSPTSVPSTPPKAPAEPGASDEGATQGADLGQ